MKQTDYAPLVFVRRAFCVALGAGAHGGFNGEGVAAIYRFEMARARRTLWQSVATPVITTSLYFVVFGAAIGSRMSEIGGVPYGAFIVPGLIMLSLLTQSISNASFGIYFPKFTGTIYELLSAPISAFEIVIGYVGAAATKSVALGLVIAAAPAMMVRVPETDPEAAPIPVAPADDLLRTDPGLLFRADLERVAAAETHQLVHHLERRRIGR
mgnify:CR=1 FL=1